MSSLEMSLGHRIRSNVNWVQKHKDRQTLLSILSLTIMISIKFTIQDVLKIYVAFNSQPRQELNVCPCKVKGRFSANLAKFKYVMLMLHFCQYSTNQTIHNYIKTTVLPAKSDSGIMFCYKLSET